MADLLPMPALIIDSGLRVQSANASFKNLGECNKLLNIQNGVFCSQSNTLLFGLKERITQLASNNTADYLTLKVPSSPLNKPMSLLVSSVTSGSEQPLYLVLIASLMDSNSMSGALLAELYDLTKAEQRLALEIVSGKSLNEIATNHNNSIHTLRTQLKTIFSKVGVNRQSELVSTLISSSLVNFKRSSNHTTQPNCIKGVENKAGPLTIDLPDGRTLAYAEFGDLDGEPVITFHPTTGSKLQCHPNNELTRAFGVRLILIDRPGFGLSSKHAERSFLSFADDVEQLANHLNLKRFSLLGYCGGGPYSMACAYKLGSRIKHLTVVSGVTPYKDIDLLHGASTVNRMLVKIATVLPESVFNLASIVAMKMVKEPESYLDELQGALCDTDKAALNEPEFMDNFTAALADSLKQGPKELAREQVLFASDWGFDVSDIQASVDLWYGDQDKHVPVELANRLSTDISSAQFHKIKDYGHFMIYHKWKDILEQHMVKIGEPEIKKNAGLR